MGLQATFKYGSNVVGVSRSTLSQQCRLQAHAFGGSSQGKSLAACYLLAGDAKADPIFPDTLGPVQAMARAIWNKVLPQNVMHTLASGAWQAVQAAGFTCAKVTGPWGAAIASMHRVGWICQNTSEPFNVTTELGVDIHLGEVCPQT